MRAARLLVTLLSATAGCGGDLVFSCTKNAQCVREGETGGTCVAAGADGTRYCAFDDDACPSGRRFDDTAGDTFAGKCTGGSSDRDLAMPSEEDMTMVPEGDMAMPPTKLTWKVLEPKIVGDLWTVGGYDEKHVWVGGPDGIWFTGDNGKTFTRQSLPGGAGNVTSIFGVDGEVWAVNHDTRIFHTTDDGMSWSLQTTPNAAAGNRLFQVWGTSKSNLFISGDGGLILHTSNGTNWMVQPINNNQIGYLNTIWGSSDMDVWASGGSGVGGVRSPMAHTTNGGQSWSVGTLASDLIIFRIWGSGDSDIFAVGEQQVVYHSVGGAFAPVKMPGLPGTAYFSVWGSGPDNVYVCGTSGTLARSTDGGKSWNEEASRTAADLTAMWGPHGNDIYAVGGSGTVIRGTP